MSGESYDLHLTTLSPIHIGSGKSYSGCEFVPAKAKSKGQIVKIIKRVNLTNYYSSLSDDKKDTFLASLTNSNFELKQFDKKIKKDFVRYQCIDNSRVDFINEVQEHIKTSDKLYIPGSSIKGAIRTAIFYDLLTEDDMDKIGRDISNNRRNNSFLSNDLLKKHFTSGFGNDAQYNIFRFMQVADTTTTNLPRIEQVLAVMATDDRRKNQFYSRHGKVVKSYLETIGANKNLDDILDSIFKENFIKEFDNDNNDWKIKNIGELPLIITDYVANGSFASLKENVTILDYEEYAYFIRNTDLKSKSFQKFVNKHSYDFLKKSSLFGNEVIISNVGDVGSVFLCPFLDKPMTLGNNMILVKSRDDAINLNFYLFLLFRSNYGQYLISTITAGSVQSKFNKTEFKSLELTMPNDELIIKFNNLVSPIFDYKNKISDEIVRLTKLRDTLLPKLMSGEIDVSKINCDLELKYNYMKYLFNQIHTPMSKSVV